MLKSCKYCGRIHDKYLVCDQKKEAEKRRQQNRADDRAKKYRSTNKWTELSRNVRKRDRYICLCCEALLVGTVEQFNNERLSVHHITPIAEDDTLRDDTHNLITVCDVHHELCEAGRIDRETQRQLVADSIARAEGADSSLWCL